jgi:hypothetical protein
METVPALTVVPARQVDTAGVIVALDQALRTLVNVWGKHSTSDAINIIFHKDPMNYLIYM